MKDSLSVTSLMVGYIWRESSTFGKKQQKMPMWDVVKSLAPLYGSSKWILVRTVRSPGKHRWQGEQTEGEQVEGWCVMACLTLDVVNPACGPCSFPHLIASWKILMDVSIMHFTITLWWHLGHQTTKSLLESHHHWGGALCPLLIWWHSNPVITTFFFFFTSISDNEPLC